jgi:photosystem II stability/assembly factor-like uncharacterized protein
VPRRSGHPLTAALRWRPTNGPLAGSRNDDIWFIEPQDAWAVNSNGQILKTSDGGDSWSERLHDPEVYFRCLDFASPTRGWAETLTLGKTLFETRHGGSTWTLVANLPTVAPSARTAARPRNCIRPMGNGYFCAAAAIGYTRMETSIGSRGSLNCRTVCTCGEAYRNATSTTTSSSIRCYEAGREWYSSEAESLNTSPVNERSRGLASS